MVEEVECLADELETGLLFPQQNLAHNAEIHVAELCSAEVDIAANLGRAPARAAAETGNLAAGNTEIRGAGRESAERGNHRLGRRNGNGGREEKAVENHPGRFVRQLGKGLRLGNEATRRAVFLGEGGK